MKTKPVITLSLVFASLLLQAEFKPVRLIEGSQPAYPDELKATGDAGEVKIRTVIDETGSVAEAEIVSASHFAFGQSALEAVRSWRFQPATEDGQPVPQTVVIPVLFKLSFEDRIKGLAGYDVFADIGQLTDKVCTWKDVKKYFPARGGNDARRMAYPEGLRGSGISEVITIQCVLSPDGLVLNPRIENLKHKELAVPAIEHLVQMRFQKPRLDGQPVYVQQKVKLVCSEDPDFGD